MWKPMSVTLRFHLVFGMQSLTTLRPGASLERKRLQEEQGTARGPPEGGDRLSGVPLSYPQWGKVAPRQAGTWDPLPQG